MSPMTGVRHTFLVDINDIISHTSLVEVNDKCSSRFLGGGKRHTIIAHHYVM